MSNQRLAPQKRMAACRGLMLYGLLLSGPYFAHHCLGTVEEQVFRLFYEKMGAGALTG